MLYASMYQRQRIAVLHERRRAGQRHLEVDRRRRDLDAAHERSCRRASWAASRSTSIAAARTSCTRSIEAEGPVAAARGGGAGRWRRRRTGGGGGWSRRRRPDPAAPAAPAAAPAAAAAGSGLYRSDDGGATWRRVEHDEPAADVLQPGAHRSEQSGSRLHGRRRPAHDERRRPDDGAPTRRWSSTTTSTRSGSTRPTPNHVLIGGDGGVAVSYDMSRTWIAASEPAARALLPRERTTSRRRTTSAAACRTTTTGAGRAPTRFSRGITNTDWFQVQGGDGFVVIIDPRDPRIVYSESQDGNIQRKNKITGEARNIRPNFAERRRRRRPRGAQPFRWNWDTPMMFSPHDPGALLVAANKVFRSTDRGDSWTVDQPGSHDQRRSQRDGDHGRAQHRDPHRRATTASRTGRRSSRSPSRRSRPASTTPARTTAW